jgi:hypothetical protein
VTVSFTCWLPILRFATTRGPAQRRRRPFPPRRDARNYRPQLDVLDDRTLPSFFGAPTSFAVGPYPQSVAVADFNRDGIPDLIVPGYGGSTLSVLLGNGHGSFGNAINTAFGSYHRTVAVADFNRDGIPDVATGNFSAFSVTVMLGNGDGSFQYGGDFGTDQGPFTLAVADFNGDGIPDLAETNVSRQTVGVLLGNGDGTFQDANNFYAGYSPDSVAVGDFNGDGFPDLAVGTENSGSVSVLLGHGDGTFGNATAYYTYGASWSMAAADLNGDGIPDLAVTNFSGVSVLLGHGDGTFGAATPYNTGGAVGVAVADLNGDGIPDLAVAGGGNTVSLLLGDGRGGFAVAAQVNAGSGTSGVAVGDFNGDGLPDLAVTDSNSNAVSVLLNQTPVTTTALTADPGPSVGGQRTTLTAAVTMVQPDQPFAPTGAVTFRDGATVLGTGTLDANGVARLSTFPVGTGYHSFTATYQGDPHFTASTSPVLNQLVTQDATTTTLTLSANPALAGQPVTLTATVTGQLTNVASPTGTVVFLDDAGGRPVNLGTAQLSGGVATFTTTALPPGSHPIVAEYVGDNNFTASTTADQPLQVNNPAPVLRGLDTTTLPEGSAGCTLTLTGSDFGTGATVQWNGTPLTVTAATATQVQVTVPAALLAEEGTVRVTVSNPGPGGGVSLPQTFTVTDAALTAAGVGLNVIGNKNFSGVVATFTDANAGATAADFTAVIVWDDGTASFGTVKAGAGNFTVSASHTFGRFSNLHTAVVTVYDKGGSTATVTDNVIDPPGPPDTPPPVGGGSAPVAMPSVLPPVVPPRHRHGRHPAAHARKHHSEHGRVRLEHHHKQEPFAP